MDLTVVMPVYNEADCIEAVANSWLQMLNRLGINFRLLLINDGSKDATMDRLASLSAILSIQVLNKVNEGHGPQSLRGYRQACSDSLWIFQVDSDDEISPDFFPVLWAKRETADFVFGERQGRKQSLARKTLSAGSRLLVRLFCGSSVPDVNVPYRLMRSACLARLLDRLPPDMFAPNVAIAGLAQRCDFRIYTVPVQNRERQTGATSLVSWKIVSIGYRSMVQIASVFMKDTIKR